MIYPYPKPRKDDVRENHFGVTIADPYRWMEDDNSEETAMFVEEQMKVTNAYLDGIPGRETIKARLKELYNYEKFSGFRVINDKILFNHNTGLQNQYCWYLQEGRDGDPELLLDPNTMSDDGTVAVSFIQESKDGRYLPYLVSESGSDWHTLRILDLEMKSTLEDHLEWVKFTFTAWQGDGFYYSAYDAIKDGKILSAKNEYMKIYYHKLGEDQKDDRLVFADQEHALRYYTPVSTKDEKHLLLYVSEGTYGNEVLLFDNEGQSFETIFTGFDSEHYYFNDYEGKLLFVTDDGAPNQKIVAFDPTTKTVAEFLPEARTSLESVEMIGDYLILSYLEDVASKVVIRNIKSGVEEVLVLPELGNVFQIGGSSELDGFLYSFGSFLKPVTVYFYDFEHNRTSVFKESKLAFDSSEYVTERHFVEASDGAKVPLFLSYKKGLKKDGNNPTELYAYGGFSVSLPLSFSPAQVYLMEQGGIYAQANIRGGLEYGDAWHKQGMLFNKQRCFDDFRECAEFLIDKGYTSSNKLAIEGGSNGGLLMGAVMNQQPELYRVVFPCVGVLDMLRYHLFTVGWGWVPEYGSPEEEEHFHNILKYSPLHNIEEKDYPSVMIRTADHDDRVVPAHSLKFGATLQEKNTSNNPILLRIDTKAGHGAGKSLEKVIDEQTDKFAFMFYEMGK